MTVYILSETSLEKYLWTHKKQNKNHQLTTVLCENRKPPPLKGKPTTLPTNLQLNMEMLVHYKHEPTISPFLDEFS